MPLLGLPCQFVGFIAIWVLFHVYKFVMHKVKKSKRPFFDKSTSPYFEEFVEGDLSASDPEVCSDISEKAIYKFTSNRVSAPIWRGVC